MASGGEASCANDPNFAIICAFFQKFSLMLNIEQPDIHMLQEWLENTDEVSMELRDLHIKLLRKMRKTVHETAWETALVKFCYLYSAQDAWEIERFGYKKSSLKVKLRILAAILEYQFQLNGKFRNKFSNLSAEELRSEPIGRDRLGHSYWLTQDPSCNFRIYQEHLDEEIWQTVASNRSEMETLISRLRGNEVVLPSLIGVIDEDSSSNSCPNAIVKPPPPEEHDDSQSSSCGSGQAKIPSIKIKLDANSSERMEKNGLKNGDAGKEHDEGENEIEEEEEESGEKEPVVAEETKSKISNQNAPLERNGLDTNTNSRKVKPIIITHTKLVTKNDEPKKRALEESAPEDTPDEPDLKKTRPSLLDNRRSKKSKYEKSSEEDDEEEEDEDEEGEDEEEGAEEEEDEEDGDAEEMDDEEDDEEENEVSEEIEEKVLVVNGEGNGKDCQSSSSTTYLREIDLGCEETDEPVGDAIEEEVMYVYGEGSGKDCEVGNNGEETTSLLHDSSHPVAQDMKQDLAKVSVKVSDKINVPKDQKNGDIEEDEGKNESVKSIDESKGKAEKSETTDSQPDSYETPEDLNTTGKRKKSESEKIGFRNNSEPAGSNNVKKDDQVLDKGENKEIGSVVKEPEKDSTNVKITEDKLSDPQIEVKESPKVASDAGSPDNCETATPSKSKVVASTAGETNATKVEKSSTLPFEPAATNTRKRRLSEGKIRNSSESESELNSDSVAPPTEEEDEADIGGKRPKMRMKMVNTELRKKVEKSRQPSGRHDSTSEEDVPENCSLNNNKPVAIETNVEPSKPADKLSEKPGEEKEVPPADSVSIQTRTTRRTPAGTPIKIVTPKPRGRNKSTSAQQLQTGDMKPSDAPTLQPEVADAIKSTTEEVILPDVMPKLEPETNGPAAKTSESAPSKATPDARKVRGRKREIDTNNIIDAQFETPVRQSRRIAQLKIREEAERRKMEEEALKKMKAEFKKKKKEESKSAGYEPPPSESSNDSDSEAETSRKAALKKQRGKGKKDRWSSGPEDEPEEDEEYDLHHDRYESDHGSPLFKSDHEFSPESDIEDESQAVPLKRARTARKEGADGDNEEDLDEACQKCGKKDHPEWILLCDNCDKGYHCSCLSPVLFIIPEGDWFCPPCQQEQLIAALEKDLTTFDDMVEQKRIKDEEELKAQQEENERKLKAEEAEKQDREKEKEQEIVSPAKKSRDERAKRRRNPRARKSFIADDDEDEETDESDDESSGSAASSESAKSGNKSNSGSSSDSDDVPIYKLRKRRQINVSYRLNEYDDLIDSAIKEEMDEVAGAGNLGRGKDISTIIEADKEEKMRQKHMDAMKESAAEEVKPEVAKVEVNVTVAKKEERDGDSDSDDFNPVKSKQMRKHMRGGRKKGRKLNNLDVSSEDDGSDEDFKTSSYETEEDEEDSISNQTESDSSLEVYRRKAKKNKKNREHKRPTRRAARARRRMEDFIVDDSEFSDDSTKKKKRTKRKHDWELRESEETEEDLSDQIDSEDLCDDSSDSEDSDGCWRPSKRRKTKTAGTKKPTPAAKGGKQPRKFYKKDPSEKPFKTKTKITKKYHSDDSDEDTPRTRGKRFAYLDMDFEDESSDDGIKPGVKRPDTPPEEREKFIKKQEEIKRMLAEKNTEAAKAVATPTLAPVDSLSTVPLSVIKGAKVLDIDYLQRKGELPSDDGETDFDEDLPDDFDPEDMDEEEIAKMMEEEDFAQQQMKVSDVNRPKKKEQEQVSQNDMAKSNQPTTAPMMSREGLLPLTQDVQRRRLPMPTIPPPLNSARFPPPSHGAMFGSHMRQGPPIGQLPYTMPSLPMGQISQPINNPAVAGQDAVNDQFKPRGRRKKITPLRDTLQKQQAAAAAAAAISAPPSTSTAKDIPPAVTGPKLSVAQPPQLYTPPTSTPPSVITRMPQAPPPHPPRPHFPEQNARFYPPPNQMPHRLPLLRHGGPMPPSPHHSLGPPYAGGPSPLRPAAPRIPTALVGNTINRQPSPRQITTFSGSEQYAARPPHPNPPHTYRPPLYGTPGYPPAPPPQQSQTPMHPTGPDYPVPPTSYGPTPPYGPYYTPPQNIGPTHSTPPPPTASAVPVSLVLAPVLPTSTAAPVPTPVSIAPVTTITASVPTTATPIIPPVIVPVIAPPQQPQPITRPKATALETYDKKSTSPLLEAEVNSNTYPNAGSVEDNDDEKNSVGRSPRNTSSEFSGLVSYFSSQHDDLNS